MKIICSLCPRHCALAEGATGACHARGNRGGTIKPLNYGKITSMNLDPIEKKPLARFHPGSRILSVGSFGCNLHCPFCQNYEIAWAGEDIPFRTVPPLELVRLAEETRPEGNIGVAFTYNEPLVGIEYIMDTAPLLRERDLKTVLVTNGYICREPLLELLPHVDAMNIDLKGFTEAFYRKLGGDLATVKESILLSAARCHVEVTTLVVPGENDSPEEISALSAWLASVNPEIPLHLSRFFPRHLYGDREATARQEIYDLADLAKQHLKYVYPGNC
jgi:pyruvate formate lyase activating enzyme